MNALPVIVRELRVRSRRGVAHWSRFALALAAALIVVSQFLGPGPGRIGDTGRSVFLWLLGAAFVLACGACALTADALSGERREGTLGLLFLTDLQSWEVIVGKLASAGLGALYAGVALAPVLMLPVLAGGVTGAEAARSGLALLITLVFALAAGLAASAVGSDRILVLCRAAAWVFGAVLAPVLAQGCLGFAAPPSIGLLSPFYTVALAQDNLYRRAPGRFWMSLALLLIAAVLWLACAATRLRRSLSEPVTQALPPPHPVRPAKPYSTDPVSNESYAAGNAPPPLPPPPRRRLDEARPVEWLVARQRGQQGLLWSAALLWVVAGHALWLTRWFPFAIRGGAGPFWLNSIFPLSWLAKALLAWATCRFFFEARRSGELELLATTPVGAQATVTAHWAAMKRLLRGPVALMVLPLLIETAYYFSLPLGVIIGSPPSSLARLRFYSDLSSVLRLGELLVELLALNWLGMYFGLTARRQINAVALTSALVVGLPLVLHTFVRIAIGLFMTPAVSSVMWYVSTLGVYPLDFALLLALAAWAKQRLRPGAFGEPTRLDWRRDTEEALRQCAHAIRFVRQWKSS